MDRKFFDDTVILTDPSDWQCCPLKELDKLLRCPICYDFFKTAVILPCSHSCEFSKKKLYTQSVKPTTHYLNCNILLIVCSLCIRRYLQIKSACPICCQPSNDSQLLNNLILNELVQQFVKNRNELLISTKLQPQHKVPSSPSDIEENNELSLSPSILNNCATTPTTRTELERDDILSPSIEPTASNQVDCPVCGCQVLQKNVNNHLDQCLKYSTIRNSAIESSSPGTSSHSLPRLPKLCYSIMKDSQIRRKLREYHLTTSGNREQMIARLQEFTLQYNAQCDSLQPMTMKQIALQVERTEKSKRVQVKKVDALNVSKNSKDEDITKEHKKYMSLHKQQFNELIKDVKQRLPTFPQEESKDKEQGHKREFKEDISDNEIDLESDFEPYVPFRKSKRSRNM